MENYMMESYSTIIMSHPCHIKIERQVVSTEAEREGELSLAESYRENIEKRTGNRSMRDGNRVNFAKAFHIPGLNNKRLGNCSAALSTGCCRIATDAGHATTGTTRTVVHTCSLPYQILSCCGTIHP